MKGYTFRRRGKAREMPPLWQPQLHMIDEHLEIGFRDLVELRFVKAFLDAGVGLKAIRNCLDHAKAYAKDERPFTTRRFQTDGRTIFLESIERSGGSQVLDLKRKQYVFRDVIAKTFKDLEIEDEAVARWRPFRGKQSIVIDPRRAFGQPIAARSGVPTIVLAEAIEVEGSIAEVARLFEISPAVVADAVKFETELRAA
jgi:uncharacterized protein (DUF433 family)